ncbi:MAG: hypothetical protein QNJ20_19540 [Paracoccaceae bacterium]|nr:hypothetical protein [Paracoccaceae bacterium]
MIELAGLPASGKTTFFKALRKELTRRKFKVHELGQIFGTPYLRQTAPRFVRNEESRELLFRHLDFKRDHPELADLVDRKLDQPDTASMHFLFWLMASRYQAHGARADAGGVLMVDEGFVQRGTAMCLRDETPDDYERYMAHVPVPNAVLAIRVRPEVAYTRAVERRGAQSLATVHAKHGHLKDYVRRDRMFRRAHELLAQRGAAIIDVPCALHDPKVVTKVADAVMRLAEAPPEERVVA